MSEDSQALIKALHPPGVPGEDDDVRFYGSNQRETLAHYRLLFPELISYRGGLFVERQFDKPLIDSLLDQAEFDTGESPIATAEETINSLGLLNEDEDEFDLAVAQANAEAIGWVWKRWLRETYAVEIEVITAIVDADQCYVTFRSLQSPEQQA
ncbi:hypothetical protein [Brevundimonas sp.]|uniref:hypothetical protein n=1 Tax=Brevundimonas sp. TaxID=1871086 RepID=UPI002ED7A9E6